MVGADIDKIVNCSKNILDKDFNSTRLKSQNPYGDGTSAKKILEIIKEYNEYFMSLGGNFSDIM